MGRGEAGGHCDLQTASEAASDLNDGLHRRGYIGYDGTTEKVRAATFEDSNYSVRHPYVTGLASKRAWWLVI